MRHSTRLFQCIRLANALLFLTAAGVALDHSVASALSRFTKDPHWSTVERSIAVVDKTADPRWNAANRHAVAAWNRAAAGTDLRLTWTPGTGGCRPERNRIVVCTAASAALDDDAQLSRQGVSRIQLGSDRNQAHIDMATILVCADCQLRSARRLVVATHELGHALGLPHSRRPGSVMFHTGGPDEPDDIDVAGLRGLYGHVDGTDRCGYFDARAGPFCF